MLYGECVPCGRCANRSQGDYAQTTFILYESAHGFSLFEVSSFDEISASLEKVQEAMRYDGGVG